jgi:hypothetical protein
MGDRHKNFEDPITETRDIRKTKFDLLGFFVDHPLHVCVVSPLCDKHIVTDHTNFIFG